MSVDAPADEAAVDGAGAAGERGNLVTRWDVVGLSAMTLGAVGAIGLLLGRRRSF